MRKNLLLSPDEGEGGGVPSPQDAQPAPTVPPPPAAPPAASTVANGPRTERDLALETELSQVKADLQRVKEQHAATEKEKKDREIRINTLEDEVRRLTTPPATPAKQKKEKAYIG